MFCVSLHSAVTFLTVRNRKLKLELTRKQALNRLLVMLPLLCPVFRVTLQHILCSLASFRMGFRLFCCWSSRCNWWHACRPRAYLSFHTHRPSWSHPSESCSYCIHTRVGRQSPPVGGVSVSERMENIRSNDYYQRWCNEDLNVSMRCSHLAGIIQPSGVTCTQHVGGNQVSRQHIWDTALIGPKADITSLNTLRELWRNCGESV